MNTLSKNEYEEVKMGSIMTSEEVGYIYDYIYLQLILFLWRTLADMGHLIKMLMLALRVLYFFFFKVKISLQVRPWKTQV